MSSKIPSQNLRHKLKKRAMDHIALANAKTPEHLLKTPSQKHSESIRKKDLRRAGVESEARAATNLFDCHTCPKQPCGKTTQTCEERTLIHRCKHCGQKVMYRFDPEVPWEYCLVCRERMK